MRPALAVARRILAQFRHDPRTIVMMILAPVLVMWILSLLFSATTYKPKIAVGQLPAVIKTSLEKDSRLIAMSPEQAREALAKAQVAASIYVADETLKVELEGSNSTYNMLVSKAVHNAMEDYRVSRQAELQEQLRQLRSDEQERLRAKITGLMEGTLAQEATRLGAEIPAPERERMTQQLQGLKERIQQKATEELTAPEIKLPAGAINNVSLTQLHGESDWAGYKYLSPYLIGIILFLFSFITSQMSLVNERSAGTYDRFVATPVRGWQIVLGYALAFGLVGLVQSSVVLAAAFYLLKMPNYGSPLLVVFTSMLLTMTSVVLGLVVSALARTPLQVIQLMLLFVSPQILLCGVFDLSSAPRALVWFSDILPLTYGINGLSQIMLRGWGFTQVWPQLAVLFGMLLFFAVIASVGLRKRRARVH